jgi:hypothetical protein
VRSFRFSLKKKRFRVFYIKLASSLIQYAGTVPAPPPCTRTVFQWILTSRTPQKRDAMLGEIHLPRIDKRLSY